MIRILGFYRRLPGISPDDFRREWAIHGDMVRTSPTISAYMKSYVQHFLTAVETSGPDFGFDGFSEVVCESVEHYRTMRGEPEHLAMANHTRQFIDGGASVIVIDEVATIL